MLTLIILGVLIVSSLLWAVFDKKNRDGAIVFGSVFFAILLGISFSFININNRFDYIVEEYDNLKIQIETYNVMDDPMIKVSSLEYDIRKDVLEMNNQISKHKVMSNSLWVNCWYSKKIGGLEKLKLNQ